MSNFSKFVSNAVKNYENYGKITTPKNVKKFYFFVIDVHESLSSLEICIHVFVEIYLKIGFKQIPDYINRVSRIFD